MNVYAVRAPQAPLRAVQKRTQDMLVVDEQVTKIARVFSERQQANETLSRSLSRATDELSHYWKLTLEEKHKNVRLVAAMDVDGEVLNHLKNMLREFEEDQMEPLTQDFRLVEDLNRQRWQLLNEMSFDVETVYRAFENECSHPLQILLDSVTQLRTKQEHIAQDMEAKVLESAKLCLEIQGERTRLTSLTVVYEKKVAEGNIAQNQAKASRQLCVQAVAVMDEQALLGKSLLEQNNRKRAEIQEHKFKTQAALKAATVRATLLESELELARIGLQSINQKTGSAHVRSSDQRTRLQELTKRCKDVFEVNRKIVADMDSYSLQIESVSDEIEVADEELEDAKAQVLSAQSITSSLTDGIATQQLRMTNTVRLHDEKQAQLDHLYKLLQLKKDAVRSAILEASQRAQSARAELPRATSDYAEIKKRLENLRKETESAARKNQNQKQTCEKVRVAAEEAEAALVAYKNARAHQYMQEMEAAVLEKQAKLQALVERCNELQAKERDLHVKQVALATCSTAKNAAEIPLTVSQSELDKLVANSVEQQQASLEAAFQLEILPQVQALEELQSGRRLELARSQREAGLDKLRAKIREMKSGKRVLSRPQQFNSEEIRQLQSTVFVRSTLKQDTSPAPAAAVAGNFVYAEGVKRYTKAAAVPPVSLSLSNVSTSPGDWFNDADLW